MKYFEQLKDKLQRNNFTACIIGIGYVGEAILDKLLLKKVKIIAIDKNIKKLNKIKKIKSFFYKKL